MATSTSSTSAPLTRRSMTVTELGDRLLEWHGGQETAVYAVGSCLSSGHSATLPSIVAALKELADVQVRTENLSEWNGLQDICRELLVFAVISNYDVSSVVVAITKILEEMSTRLRKAAVPEQIDFILR